VDIGCGSGAWVTEVADLFPHARVYGTDLSPVQRSEAPENVEYIVNDFTKGLDFDSGSTDLVQSRLDNHLHC
jgi:methylase of polypeptide subunit release factors